MDSPHGTADGGNQKMKFVVKHRYSDTHVSNISQFDGEIEKTTQKEQAQIFEDTRWQEFWSSLDDDYEMVVITLCQDCLRVVEVLYNGYVNSDYGKGVCPCGGEVCHCHRCMRLIKKLEAWDWKQAEPFTDGIQKPVIDWSAEGGCVAGGEGC